VFRWAWKTLVSQWGALLGSAAGIASALVLVIFFHAVFRGESTQIVAYPDHMQPDIWVMQTGVYNMHMANSFVWDWKADRIARIPGVRQVTPILYLNSVVNAGSMESFSFVVGLTADSRRAGPWAMQAGKAMPAPGEAVIPDVLSRLAGIGIGESITLTDKTFRVVGLSEGTFSMANTIIFVAFEDLQDILTSTGTYSYLLVDAEDGVDSKALAATIMDEVEKVNALPHAAFIENDFHMAMQMGVEIIFMMTVICSLLAVLIVGFTSYSQVVNKRRELAIAKALGVCSRSLIGSVLFQSMTVTLLGYALAVLFALTVIPRISLLVPHVTLIVASDAIVQIGIVALLASMLGALIPAWFVARLDPASAFHV
jgi:putative ABC transport system permease protein